VAIAVPSYANPKNIHLHYYASPSPKIFHNGHVKRHTLVIAYKEVLNKDLDLKTCNIKNQNSIQRTNYLY